MEILVIIWLLCGVLCYFIMKSKGYDNNICLTHGVGGVLLGFIWLIVVLLKKENGKAEDKRMEGLELIERLAELKERGIISEEEYISQKAELLDISQTLNNRTYQCPKCGSQVRYGQGKCSCGQVFDWSMI